MALAVVCLTEQYIHFIYFSTGRGDHFQFLVQIMIFERHAQNYNVGHSDILIAVPPSMLIFRGKILKDYYHEAL